MRFPAKSTTDFEIVPAGNHIAICNAVVDLGLQPGSGMYPAPKHQVYLRFELPTESITYTKDGEEVTGPMSIGRTFTASMSEKANLRKFIEAWFGKKFPNDAAAELFEHEKLLGRKCLLNVTHNEAKNGNTYANATNATPIPKELNSDYAQYNPSLFLDLTDWNQEAYDALPEWLQKKIDERLDDEMPLSSTTDSAPIEFGDDIPF